MVFVGTTEHDQKKTGLSSQKNNDNEYVLQRTASFIGWGAYLPLVRDLSIQARPSRIWQFLT